MLSNRTVTLVYEIDDDAQVSKTCKGNLENTWKNTKTGVIMTGMNGQAIYSPAFMCVDPPGRI